MAENEPRENKKAGFNSHPQMPLVYSPSSCTAAEIYILSNRKHIVSEEVSFQTMVPGPSKTRSHFFMFFCPLSLHIRLK
jgi:hypothetical protein